MTVSRSTLQAVGFLAIGIIFGINLQRNVLGPLVCLNLAKRCLREFEISRMQKVGEDERLTRLEQLIPEMYLHIREDVLSGLDSVVILRELQYCTEQYGRLVDELILSTEAA